MLVISILIFLALCHLWSQFLAFLHIDLFAKVLFPNFLILFDSSAKLYFISPNILRLVHLSIQQKIFESMSYAFLYNYTSFNLHTIAYIFQSV